MGDVECFADEDETEPIEFAAFTTDIYHSQYRALEGFALINVFMRKLPATRSLAPPAPK